jgi:hypothetical protein
LSVNLFLWSFTCVTPTRARLGAAAGVPVMDVSMVAEAGADRGVRSGTKGLQIQTK